MAFWSLAQKPSWFDAARSAILLTAMICLHCQSAYGQVTTEAGLNDLVILDPGQHERGLPAVVVDYMSGHPEIDIPPTVHVHRYYYSGNKIFQGPIIQGGPILLVANHPKTGERLYVNVVLPAGTPRIEHTKNTISYIYDERRVEVKFRHFPFDPCVAIVKHHSGKGLGLAIRDKREKTREHVKAKLANAEGLNSAKELAMGGGKLVKGVRSSLGGLTTMGTDTIKQVAKMIPGVVYLSSKGEQQPQRDYESTIRTATLKNEKTEIPFVRTNR